MAPEPRPKGANAPIAFAFSNAMKFVSEKPNINNMPAHAWNTATHARTTSAPPPSMSTATAGPSTSRPGSQAPSLLTSTGSNTIKNATSVSSSPFGAPLQPSITAASPLNLAAFPSPVNPLVMPSAPTDEAAPDTAASSPLSSPPPSPSALPPSMALTASSTTPNVVSWALPAPSNQSFKTSDRAQVATAVTTDAFAAPLPIYFSPVGRSIDAAGAQTQEMHLNPHRVDPYEIELEFRSLATQFPVAFETLVGLYLQESGRTPAQIGQNVTYNLSGRGWDRDLRRKDILDADPQAAVEYWVVPSDRLFLAIAAEAGRYADPFEASIRYFAAENDRSGLRMEQIIRKAGWTTWIETVESVAFKVIHDIFIMDEGEEKDQKLAQARKESPLFFEFCLKDPFCGTGLSVKKRKRADQGVHVVFSYTPGGCKEVVIEPKPKRIRMSAARPMQVHNVPLEERAFDSKGNRLPWALEWPEGHPNARGQKRHIEEKGPFGKSNKRKGSSRTRTATPAKKENPTLDSFEKALNYDLKKQAESPTDPNTLSRSQSDAPSVNKEPTQVLLYGYPSSRQWQAIDTYEKICGGIICEDYERQPDASLRRYPNTISNAPRAHMTRTLTRAEKILAFQYAGGAHWVKVTFDSAQAAERAIENSPVQIQQHWVYAQLYYHGVAPQLDAPIATTAEERTLGRPLSKHSQVYGPSSIQQAGTLQGGPFAIPPNSTFNPSTSNSDDQRQEDASLTSSTASSGTATGPETSNLRNRSTTQAGHQVQAQHTNPQMMRFFPDTPRTILRPAHEALLPQPTFWERQFRWLADHGLMPGEVIGNGVPLLDNGQIDWHRASFYWKFFYWVDSTFGTDYCGLRNDD